MAVEAIRTSGAKKEEHDNAVNGQGCLGSNRESGFAGSSHLHPLPVSVNRCFIQFLS
jgi:hypothetical protein